MLLALCVPLALSAAFLPQELAVDERPAAAGEWGFRPAPGARIEVNPPAFVWRPQPGALHYEWQASRDASFEGVERGAEVERLNVHCPPEPFEVGSWNWRFRYRTQTGEVSAWSSVREFQVTDAAPLFAIPTREELLARGLP
jgi:hypothetical protein